MDHLRQLGNSVSVSIPADESGFTGRECPNFKCEGYFKIEFGTGLPGSELPCHCPYCGYTAGHDHFWTKAQVEYAKSIALRKITGALHKDLKRLEVSHKPKGAFGIGISMKVKPGRPTPIRHYREQRLETEVTCDNCTLRYSIYGVFAFCPDCGEHNSLQILKKNVEVVEKMLDMAAAADTAVAEKLVENALEDCVSAFDGFGRELCRVHFAQSANPGQDQIRSFQNLSRAQSTLMDLHGIDLMAFVTAETWGKTLIAFQKRHLLSHKMGVIDQDYIERTGDTTAIPGRKVTVSADEVRELAQAVHDLARGMASELTRVGASAR